MHLTDLETNFCLESTSTTPIIFGQYHKNTIPTSLDLKSLLFINKAILRVCLMKLKSLKIISKKALS